MIKEAFHYTQGNQVFYSSVFSYKEIINSSIVSIYSRENRLGYQRALNERHLKKIVLSLKTEESPISPTSILLGIDQDNINIKQFNNDTISLEFTKSQDENIFRIIDGQHRIMSIKRYIQELMDKNLYKDIEEIEEYKFSVIIMPIGTENRIREVEVFQSINAKAKPLKTDLTKLALIRYEELERLTNIDYSKHLANRIIFSLNDNGSYDENEKLDFIKNKTNVWKNAIKIDINNDDEIGVIGYSAFYKSIEPICKFYVEEIRSQILNEVTFEYLDALLNDLSDQLTFNLFIPMWDIISNKWNECFTINKLSYENEVYFDEDYYIQKNMGLRPLHHIMIEIIKKNESSKLNYDVLLEEFNNVINFSTLSSKDWKKAGRFKGLSSEAGFKHIENIILNKKDR
ncbi:DGQHR domain-containing protein [Gottfriedia sp. S16(2024)]|uniref:DGQHR domain-containing protein n=1 Tax=Gottfriedia sp. S16(2024) TaxID=3162883 RepID=UPI003D23D468